MSPLDGCFRLKTKVGDVNDVSCGDKLALNRVINVPIDVALAVG